MHSFPAAHGLVVAFSNQVGCENTPGVPQIHTASKTICSTFSKLGYAYCIFQECCKAELLAVYQILAKIDYPSSYGTLFTYFTGHGQGKHISTMDGYISINHLKQLLSDKENKKLKEIAKVLFFDCCRTSTPVLDLAQTPSVENLVIFYVTPLECQAFLDNDKGMGVATIEFVKLLERRESCSLFDLFVALSREVKEAIKQANPSLLMRPDFEGSFSKLIDLYTEKLRASKVWLVRFAVVWMEGKGERWVEGVGERRRGWREKED